MPNNIGLAFPTSQPSRGTLRSMPMSVSSDANTGAAFVSFPLALTQSRALTPNVSLNYHANQGNGVFGIGMDLSGVINITRTGLRGGVPQYDDTDIFKLLYLAINNISKKWTMPIHNWKDAMNRFTIEFDQSKD